MTTVNIQNRMTTLLAFSLYWEGGVQEVSLSPGGALDAATWQVTPYTWGLADRGHLRIVCLSSVSPVLVSPPVCAVGLAAPEPTVVIASPVVVSPPVCAVGLNSPAPTVVIVPIVEPGWINQDAPDGGWCGVAYSPSLGVYVAVGGLLEREVEIIMYSDDAETWIAATNPIPTIGYSSVCWAEGLGLFVAVSGTDPFVITSPDGETWTAYDAPCPGWNDVCWSPELELLVAVGDRNSYPYGAMSSEDGEIWTPRSVPVNISGSTGVCWAPALAAFYAVGRNTSWGAAGMKSVDGEVWSSMAMPERVDSICYANTLGLLCAVGAGAVLTSSDGSWWDTRVNPDPPGEFTAWYSVCWSESLGLLCAVGESDTAVKGSMTSPDGIVWTIKPQSDWSRWDAVCRSNTLFVAVGVGVSVYGHRVMTAAAL